MSGLGAAVADYLATRRSLGFKLEREGKLLSDFVAYLERTGAGTVTVDAALAWASLPADADPAWWAARLAVVRGFARWMTAFEPATEVPPADVWPVRSRRAQPYPYTDADIEALMDATAAIPDPLRAATHRTLIGLLAATGMRVGEAIAADRTDVDVDGALIVVRHAKFDKSRHVAVHPSTAAALRAYTKIRDDRCPHPQTAAFFVSVAGTRLHYKNVHFEFHRLVGQIGLTTRGARCRPRIHDLRHRFAITTLLDWYRDGLDVAARMPQLSAYLGHADPTGTYWYLHAEPELLALAARRLEPSEQTRR